MPLRLIGVALLYVAITGARAKHQDVRVVVVVNSASTVRVMSRVQLSRIFLRQTSTWSDGDEILPVDQVEKSPARIAFVRDVQRQSMSALRRYWQERIFSGDESPPPERVTNAEVLTYVRSNEGAIGYVVEGTDLGTGVKAIDISDGDRDATGVQTHN